MTKTQDLYRGTLLGAAIGEALGATTEGLSRSEIRSQLGGQHRSIKGGGPFGFKPGQTGDLTSLILATATHLIETATPDPKELMKALAAVEPAANRDDITGEAIGSYKPRGKDVFSTARKALEARKGSAPLGHALPRLAPVALLRRLLFQELTSETILACQLTHQDQLTIDAALAFAFGVSYLTSGKDSSKLLFKTWRFVSESRPTPLYVETVGGESPSPDMVLMLKSVNDAQYDDLKADGNAQELVKAAYWLTLEAIDFEEGMIRAVNMGQSNMLMGTIAGALLGARFGFQAMPEEWIQAIDQRKALESFADKLCKMAEPKK
jgi:ADP-ribosyl-[dinitrogen reductase] hydrolase